MHFVVELHFDATLESKLKEVGQILRVEGMDLSDEILGVRPHITLCSSKNVDLKMADLLKSILSLERRFDVTLSHFGLFPNQGDTRILFVGPSPTALLLRLHEEVYCMVKECGGEPFDFVRPGFMVFHSTLSHKIPVGMLPRAMQITGDLVPLSGQVIRASVVEYFPAVERFGFEFEQAQVILSVC